MEVKKKLGYAETEWFDLIADIGIEFAENNTVNFFASRDICSQKAYWDYILKRVRNYSEKWMTKNLDKTKSFNCKPIHVQRLFKAKIRKHFNKTKTVIAFNNAQQKKMIDEKTMS